ncbi:hypothetical protein BaRGS_00031804, partial [Batillaria attramentaria]
EKKRRHPLSTPPSSSPSPPPTPKHSPLGRSQLSDHGCFITQPTPPSLRIKSHHVSLLNWTHNVPAARANQLTSHVTSTVSGNGGCINRNFLLHCSKNEITQPLPVITALLSSELSNETPPSCTSWDKLGARGLAWQQTVAICWRLAEGERAVSVAAWQCHTPLTSSCNGQPVLAPGGITYSMKDSIEQR